MSWSFSEHKREKLAVEIAALQSLDVVAQLEGPLCVDEKAQIQTLDRSQPLLPMGPGQTERGTPD